MKHSNGIDIGLYKMSGKYPGIVLEFHYFKAVVNMFILSKTIDKRRDFMRGIYETLNIVIISRQKVCPLQNKKYVEKSYYEVMKDHHSHYSRLSKIHTNTSNLMMVYLLESSSLFCLKQSH